MKPISLIPALCLSLAVTSASASTALRLDFDQLAQRADRVVEAKLASSHSAWNPTGRLIFTRYRFVVRQELAGSGPAEFDVVQPGGTVGRWAQRTAGYPGFADQAPLVLFLRRATDGYQVVGMSQGVFLVHRDQGRDLLVQRIEGLHFLGDPGRPLTLHRGQAIERIRTWFGRGSRP